MKKYFFVGLDNQFFKYDDVFPEQPKWCHTTWRKEIESGRKTWGDFLQYRLGMMFETETMERCGLDTVWSTIEIPMSIQVKYKQEYKQAYISVE